jgi:sigma-E factor negative regulatory protein RseB
VNSAYRRLAVGCLVAGTLASGLVPTPSAFALAALPVLPDAAPPPTAPAPGASDTRALELLDRAREAAESQPFDGVVDVEWHDGPAQHSAQVPVHSAGGVLRFGDEVVGAGARRLIHGSGGWLTLWGHDVAALGPPATAKYHLALEDGPDVAGRPTELVLVSLAGRDHLRERLYVDRQSGLLLRRELLNARGQPSRSVAFTAITPGGAGAAAGGPEAMTVATAPGPSRSAEPSPARHLAAPYKLKRRIGDGYRLVGAYKAKGGVVQQFFSDGLHGLSVFEQRGHLSGAETSVAGESGGGREVEIAGHTMRAYSASVGEAVVWESDGMVYTAVTDAPWMDLAEAVTDLPHADPPGRLRRVAQAVVSLFRWR